TLQWLGFRVLLANCHQSGHLGFGDQDFFASPIGEREVGDFEIAFRQIDGMSRFRNCAHDVLRISKLEGAVAHEAGRKRQGHRRNMLTEPDRLRGRSPCTAAAPLDKRSASVAELKAISGWAAATGK